MGPTQVQGSPVFRRNGIDIHSDVLISVAQAILGGTATGQGLYETISIVVRWLESPDCCTCTYNLRLRR